MYTNARRECLWFSHVISFYCYLTWTFNGDSNFNFCSCFHFSFTNTLYPSELVIYFCYNRFSHIAFKLRCSYVYRFVFFAIQISQTETDANKLCENKASQLVKLQFISFDQCLERPHKIWIHFNFFQMATLLGGWFGFSIVLKQRKKDGYRHRY